MSKLMNWIINWLGSGKYFFVEFDGDSAYINCGSDANLEDLHGATGFTVDGWVRIPDEQLEGYGTIASKYDVIEAAPTGWYFVADQGSGVLVSTATYSTNPAASITAENMTAGVWAHVLTCFNPVDAKLYSAIDGVWSTYSVQTAAVGVIGTDAGIDFLMGAAHNGGKAATFLAGDIQWLRLSSGVRYEIGEGFTSPDMCPPPDTDGITVEIWALDEGSGIIANAMVNNPTNRGAMTDCTWETCVEE